MVRRLLAIGLMVMAMLGGALYARPAVARELPIITPAVSCASLRGFDPHLADYPTQITDTKEVVGQCVVEGIVSPQIRFEVRLPLKSWTQRFLQTGCGALCGQVRIEAPQRACPALQRGEFVTATTDMGHSGQGGTFGASDQQLRVDFAYRGVHATAVVAKALIRQFYGRPATFSYFSGCSDGGREGLMEAQRYPQDFDGIAAGAPAMNFLVQNTIHHAWAALSSDPQLAKPVLTPADMPVLHAAAVAACDADDGLKDGLISEPMKCSFDPRTIICRVGQVSGCLSAAAAGAAARIYAGARDPEGRKLEVGGIMPGSELAWPGVAVIPDPASWHGPPLPPGMPPIPGSAMFASDTIRWLAYRTPVAPNWQLSDFRFDDQAIADIRPMHGIYDSTDPDLSSFAAAGGRLLMWHGLQDQHISPTNTVAYAEAVQNQMGAVRATAILRTFLIPGMYHCGEGNGMTSIDVLTPLMNWVEDGRAPESIVASRNDAEAAQGRGRLIYAWPAISALRTGSDPELPASWTRVLPRASSPNLYSDWVGADFYRPGYERDCGFTGEEYRCRAIR